MSRFFKVSSALGFAIILSLAVPRFLWASPSCISFTEEARHFVLEGSFIVPNEPNPVDARPFLIEARGDAVVTVGSERALFDFLMVEAALELRVVDHDSQIIDFHKINAVLMRASEGNHGKYLKLRHESSGSLWRKTLEQAREREAISAFDLQLALNRHSWWQELTHSDPRWTYLYSEKPYEIWNYYRGVNYLVDSSHFPRLYRLASSGRYHAELLDLSDSQRLKAYVDRLEANGISLALLDLSNAWQGDFPNNYLGQLGTSRVLGEFSRISSAGSLVMVTFGERAFQPMWYRVYRYSDFIDYVRTPNSWSGKPLSWEHVFQYIDWKKRESMNSTTVLRAAMGEIGEQQ